MNEIRNNASVDGTYLASASTQPEPITMLDYGMVPCQIGGAVRQRGVSSQNSIPRFERGLRKCWWNEKSHNSGKRLEWFRRMTNVQQTIQKVAHVGRGMAMSAIEMHFSTDEAVALMRALAIARQKATSMEQRDDLELLHGRIYEQMYRSERQIMRVEIGEWLPTRTAQIHSFPSRHQIHATEFRRNAA